MPFASSSAIRALYRSSCTLQFNSITAASFCADCGKVSRKIHHVHKNKDVTSTILPFIVRTMPCTWSSLSTIGCFLKTFNHRFRIRFCLPPQRISCEHKTTNAIKKESSHQLVHGILLHDAQAKRDSQLVEARHLVADHPLDRRFDQLPPILLLLFLSLSSYHF